MKPLIFSILIVGKLAALVGVKTVDDGQTRMVEAPVVVVLAGDPLTGGYRRKRSD